MSDLYIAFVLNEASEEEKREVEKYLADDMRNHSIKQEALLLSQVHKNRSLFCSILMLVSQIPLSSLKDPPLSSPTLSISEEQVIKAQKLWRKLLKWKRVAKWQALGEKENE